ncbi:HTH-type transcriptional repressor CytR [Ruminiclostridium hungatei]|uniref:HTH-type transcriptional repressor CytR n=1 Tax=Ruminiclostridium hungatei TaxID=48256 RepID=A0A1V4SJL0_RUMHU|nr:LacI family DNA-binding transcriptional regulator [Ruminiclostridium hungatei]OPX44050.1 HTH-type transcriptional repressor CytR [Ruminiclostridium hungatei]
MATIHDVAEKAGVSVATVSRVINKIDTVSLKTVEKVKKAIDELDYHPNNLARDLRRAESNRILVLLQSISNPFYATIVKGIEDVAQKHNYSIMLCNTDSDLIREKNYIDLLAKKVVRGAILLDSEMTKDELNVVAEENDLVLCCEYKQGVKVPHVMIDNYLASKTVAKHLIALGHRRIALIAGDSHLSSTKLRYKGYVDALQEAGINTDENLIYNSETSSFKMGMRAMETILNTENRPTAVFAMSDVLAIGAIKSINSKGLCVPDDIAVAGFDGIEFAGVMNPSLTTIVQPSYDMGCIAMEMLIKEMKEDAKNNREVIIEHELVIRESTVKRFSNIKSQIS